MADQALSSTPSPDSNNTPKIDLAAAEISSGGGQAQLHRPDAGVMKVQRIEKEELKSLAEPMLEILRKKKTGAADVKEAEDLAKKVTLEDQSPLLKYAEDSRMAQTTIADRMLDGRSKGNAGPVGDLLSEIRDVTKEINVEKAMAPKTWFQTLATVFNKRFEPIMKMYERYEKVQPVLEAKHAKVKTLIQDTYRAEEEAKELQNAIIDGFPQLEISIAAAEIARDREVKSFNEEADRLKDSSDMKELHLLKLRRDGIVDLDNRLMALKNERVTAILDMPQIDIHVANIKQLRTVLENVDAITFKEIKMGVALAVSIHDQRLGVAVAGKEQEMNQALQNLRRAMLGQAQKETHELATLEALKADYLVKAMDETVALLDEGNRLVLENIALNKAASAKLREGEERLKVKMREAYRAVASPEQKLS